MPADGLDGEQRSNIGSSPFFEPVPVRVAAEVSTTATALKLEWRRFPWRSRFIGFFMAYTTYYKKSDRADRVAAQFKGLYTTLLNKYYVDELYDALFVNRAKDTGRGLWRFDSTHRGRRR